MRVNLSCPSYSHHGLFPLSASSFFCFEKRLRHQCVRRLQRGVRDSQRPQPGQSSAGNGAGHQAQRGGGCAGVQRAVGRLAGSFGAPLRGPRGASPWSDETGRTVDRRNKEDFFFFGLFMRRTYLYLHMHTAVFLAPFSFQFLFIFF